MIDGATGKIVFRVTPEMRRMSRSDLERYAAERAAWCEDYRRQIESLQEAIRDGWGRGRLSLEDALDRAGWGISSRPSFGEMVVIRPVREAGEGGDE